MTDLSTNPRVESWDATPAITGQAETEYFTVAGHGRTLFASPPNATSATTNRWESYVSRRIGELARREFDFTGLTPPSQGTLEEAWRVANDIFRFDTATPSVVPSDDGSVVFVWHKAGWDVEIDVAQGERFVWAHERSTGRGFSGPLQEHSESLSKLLVSLSAS